MTVTARVPETARAVDPPPPRRYRLSAINTIIVIMTLLGLFLRLWQFTRPGSLTGIVEYDDGPYVGSSILLTHGIFPYRDYIFVQPPGITVILAPIAALSRIGLLSSAGVMSTDRIITALVASACVPLLGWLVRHRGVAAVTIACGGLAIYPGSIYTAHTVLLENYMCLLVLIAALVLFDGERLTTSPQRILGGGAILGVAGAVEAWAIVPVGIVCVLFLPKFRRMVRFLAGVAAGFLVLVLPFFLLSPKGFYAGVITAQIGSRPRAIRVAPLYRLQQMAGFMWFHPWSGMGTVLLSLLILTIVVCATITASLILRRLPDPFEVFILGMTAGSILMFMTPSQFLYHFMGFLGPFLAASMALPLARCAGALHEVLPLGRINWAGAILAGLALPLIVAGAVLQQVRISSEAPWPIVSSQIQALIPPGACVLSDTAPPLIMTGHLVPQTRGCPVMMDAMGADLELSHGLKPDTGAWRVPAVRAMWWYDFTHAQYVLLRVNQASPRIAWTPPLQKYFYHAFRQVAGQQINGGSYNLYVRRTVY